MKRTLGVCYYPEHWPEDIWATDAQADGGGWFELGCGSESSRGPAWNPSAGALRVGLARPCDRDPWGRRLEGHLGHAHCHAASVDARQAYPDMLAHDAAGRKRASLALAAIIASAIRLTEPKRGGSQNLWPSATVHHLT